MLSGRLVGRLCTTLDFFLLNEGWTMWERLAVWVMSCCSKTLPHSVVGGLSRDHGSLVTPLLQLLVEPGLPQPCVGIVACSVESAVRKMGLVGFCEVVVLFL